MKKVAEIKTIKRLENHPGANCTVVEFDNGNVNFISYSTRVISIENALSMNRSSRKIECTCTYSATTRSQIGWFLKEYAPDLNYYDIKKIVGQGFVKM